MRTDQESHPIDPNQVLDTVVSELELLLEEAPLGAVFDLVSLHGALLIYNLEGSVRSLPSPAFGASKRRRLERRVLRAAAKISARCHGDASATERLANAEIEARLDLIDPELRSQAS